MITLTNINDIVDDNSFIYGYNPLNEYPGTAGLNDIGSQGEEGLSQYVAEQSGLFSW